MGAMKDHFYRSGCGSRYPRDGRFIEELGSYDPTKAPSAVKIDVGKGEEWIAAGASPPIP
jgi:small subunit ribosomal protein S16